MTVREIFEQRIPGEIKSDPERAKSVNTIYQFNVTGDEACTWHVDLTVDPPVIAEGSTPDAKCTITIGDKDLVAIVEKTLNPQMAFMGGKLKIAGDMAAALKLSQVL